MTTALSSSMGAQMGMAQSQYAGQDVQDKSRAIDSLKRDLNAPKDKAKKLREACEGFESVFIQKMWEQMRATVPKGGMLQGRDEQYWQGMFDQELSKKMSSAGGIGLADMMYDQLSRNLVSASRTTASALGGANSGAKDGDTGFVASAAPLLPPVGQSTPSTAAKGVNSVKASAQGAIYGQEVAQPEAAQLEAAANPQTQSQNPDSPAPTGSANAQAGMPEAGTAAGPQAQVAASAGAQPASPTPPEVQQVLEQLRAQSGMGTTMTGAQAIAAVQAMTPAQALGLSQGMSWAQVQSMHPSGAQLAAAAGVNPEMLGQAGMLGQTAAAIQGQAAPSGLDNARAAAQTANTRMPAGGVLPPMTTMQRQARMNYSAAKVQGNGVSSQGHSPITQPASAAAAPAVAQAAAPNVGAGATTAMNTTNAQQASTMPMNPNLSNNVQGSPGVSPTKFVQNSPLIPSAPVQASSAQPSPVQAANTPVIGMTGEQIAALSGQGQPSPQGQAQPSIGQMVEAAPMHAPSAPKPAMPPTAQEPEIINTTFTTNVPPSRRNSRAGQRVPKGQAVIRTLNTGGQS